MICASCRLLGPPDYAAQSAVKFTISSLWARDFVNAHTSAPDIVIANFASQTDQLKKEASNYALRLLQAVGRFLFSRCSSTVQGGGKLHGYVADSLR